MDCFLSSSRGIFFQSLSYRKSPLTFTGFFILRKIPRTRLGSAAHLEVGTPGTLQDSNNKFALLKFQPRERDSRGRRGVPKFPRTAANLEFAWSTKFHVLPACQVVLASAGWAHQKRKKV